MSLQTAIQISADFRRRGTLISLGPLPSITIAMGLASSTPLRQRDGHGRSLSEAPPLESGNGMVRPCSSACPS